MAHVLKVDKIAGTERAEFVEREQIVVPSQANLRHLTIGEQTDDGGTKAHVIKTEQETAVVGSHLQQRALETGTFLESRARLGIEAENGFRKQVIHTAFSFLRAQYNNDLARENNPLHVGNQALIKLVIY